MSWFILLLTICSLMHISFCNCSTERHFCHSCSIKLSTNHLLEVAKAPNELATSFENFWPSWSFPSYTNIFLLVITPSFWWDSLFTIAFHFLLKNKSEGGISSSKIEVRSPTKVSSELGFPKLVCKGVNDVIGESVSVEGSCHVVFGVLAGVVVVEWGTTCPVFMKASNQAITFGSFSPASDALISWNNTSGPFGNSSALFLVEEIG